MYTKTLICHSVLSLTRAGLCGLGNASWQKAYEERSQLSQIDQNIVDKTEDNIKMALYVLIALSLVIDVIVIFRRNCARLIIYLEAVILIVLSFVPYDQGTYVGEINLL